MSRIGYAQIAPDSQNTKACLPPELNPNCVRVASKKAAENNDRLLRVPHQLLSVKTGLTSELNGKGLEAGQEGKTANPEPSNLHFQLDKTAGLLNSISDVVGELESWI